MVNSVDLVEDEFNITITDNWNVMMLMNPNNIMGFFTGGVPAGIVSRHTGKNGCY